MGGQFSIFVTCLSIPKVSNQENWLHTCALNVHAQCDSWLTANQFNQGLEARAVTRQRLVLWLLFTTIYTHRIFLLYSFTIHAV